MRTPAVLAVPPPLQMSNLQANLMCVSREYGVLFPISLFMSQLLGRENKSGLQGAMEQKQKQATGRKNTEKQTWRCWPQDPVGAPSPACPTNKLI